MHKAVHEKISQIKTEGFTFGVYLKGMYEWNSSWVKTRKSNKIQGKATVPFTRNVLKH